MGTNTIPSAASGTVIKASDHNALRTALVQDFVPRASGGNALMEAGSLGSATLRWLNLYATKLFVGSNNVEISTLNNELIFKIAGTEYARITTSHLFPPGMITQHSINANIGTAGRYQWLYCNGQAVSRADYARLYAIVGDRYGNGDGSTTFNVPDLRGMIVRGMDDARGVDPDAASRTAMGSSGATGDAVGSVQPGGTKRPTNPFTTTVGMDGVHQHALSVFARSQANFAGNNTNFPVDVGTGGMDYFTDNEGNHNHTVDITGGGDTETRMRNAYLTYIIKT